MFALGTSHRPHHRHRCHPHRQHGHQGRLRSSPDPHHLTRDRSTICAPGFGRGALSSQSSGTGCRSSSGVQDEELGRDGAVQPMLRRRQDIGARPRGQALVLGGVDRQASRPSSGSGTGAPIAATYTPWPVSRRLAASRRWRSPAPDVRPRLRECRASGEDAQKYSRTVGGGEPRPATPTATAVGVRRGRAVMYELARTIALERSDAARGLPRSWLDSPACRCADRCDLQ